MNYKKIFSFLFIAFGLSALSFHFQRQIEIDGTLSLVFLILLVLAQMWSPAIAAMVMKKEGQARTMKEYGFRSGRLNLKWLFTALVAPALVIAGTGLVIFVLGNIMGYEGFGKFILGGGANAVDANDFFLAPTSTLLSHFPALADSLNLYLSISSGWGELLQLWILLIAVGLIIGVPFLLGSEIGWRGFLLKETQSLGFQGSAIVTGLAWGIWSCIPFFMIGFLDLEMIMIAIGSCVAISFPLSYLALKTGSVISSTVFRAVLGTTGIVLQFFVLSADPLYGSVSGVAGIFAFLAFTFIILVMDKDFVKKYRDLIFGDN